MGTLKGLIVGGILIDVFIAIVAIATNNLQYVPWLALALFILGFAMFFFKDVN